ncbi:MAG: lipoyl synthase [Spirochaetota bacterium]|nr:lipoyl synthase [Spirochaetota bacterium]
MKEIAKKPLWLRKKIFYSEENLGLYRLIKEKGIHTVCEEARCPNRSECYHDKTATFLILGRICTRSCQFCSVESMSENLRDTLAPPDPQEAIRVAEMVDILGLDYVVLTSVTRDDLSDGGARHFARSVRAVKGLERSVLVEVLTPDFKADKDSIKLVMSSEPDVYNHNIETVERLSPVIRRQGGYRLSLSVLETVKTMRPDMMTKSGILVGLGESREEMIRLFQDLKSVGCDILTIGQYLQPTRRNIAVREYVSEETFAEYESEARDIGIAVVQSLPYARSSYRARESYISRQKALDNNKDKLNLKE